MGWGGTDWDGMGAREGWIWGLMMGWDGMGRGGAMEMG